MPKGPKGQKRPADVIGNAVCVMEIAALQALDTRTTVQRMLGEPPCWRSALAQKGLVD